MRPGVWVALGPAVTRRGGLADWQRALDLFLEDWRERPEVVGAVLFGSHVHGTANESSDVDVHIVLSNETPWRERGNRIVDGVLVEYFATPERVYRALHEAGLQRNWAGVARMFAHGQVLFDKTGAVARIRRWARRELSRRLRSSSRAEREMAMYTLWDGLEGARDLVRQRSPGFWHYYHQVLQRSIDQYGRAIGAESVAPVRTWQYFTSEKYRRAYRISPFPDRRFSALAAACMRTRVPRVAVARLSRLVEHVHQELGGFSIDGWRLRTPATKD